MKRRNFIKNTAIGAAGMTMIPLYSMESSYNKLSSAEFNGKSIIDGNTIILNPIDNGQGLINPKMGWTIHYYDNHPQNYGANLEPSDIMEDFPGLSTVYLRIPWSLIEPEEGKFQWEILDTPAQRWIEKGRKVAFRITASEPIMRWAAPEWVANAGAKGNEWGKGKMLSCWGESWESKVSLWEPVYDDPIFLEKVENFIKAMAERYDGNSNVSFIDIGHMGTWGEGHTVLSTQIEYSDEVLKKHIDLYCNHFKQTQLCISDDYAGHNERGETFPITDYAYSKGVTIRDDSIIIWHKPNHWYHAEMAQLFWPEYPVILETDHYGDGRRKGTWKKDLLMQSVEDYHASYMSIHWWPKEFLAENADIIDRINLRLGYRLQLNSITYPRKVQLGQAFEITQAWVNAGVAPCYPGGYPCITLKDEKGGIVSVLTDKKLNMRNLEVAPPHEAVAKKISTLFTIANAYDDTAGLFFRVAKPGKYDVYVSVGQEDGTPVFELPYSGNDGHKRYKVGTIYVTGRRQ